MADFTIVAPEPFVIDGTKGTYELPRLKDLSAEQIAALADVEEAGEEIAPRCKAVREFLLFLCPGLADEPLTDTGYVSLFNALGEGSGISVGES